MSEAVVQMNGLVDVPVEASDIVGLADNLRLCDAHELVALGYNDKALAINVVCSVTGNPRAVWCDEGLLGLYGVAEQAPNCGMPWSLFTTLAAGHKRQIVRHAHDVVYDWSHYWHFLANVCWTGNTTALRFIASLGFHFTEVAKNAGGYEMAKFEWRRLG